MSANDVHIIQENASSDFVDRILTSVASGQALVINSSNLPELRALTQSDISGLVTALSGKVASSELGAANGVATLGADSKITASQLPSSLVGKVDYQGSWNASTNSPTIPTAGSTYKGYYYVVSANGATSVDGITDWKVGDWIICNGTVWEKVDNTDSVTSVAGKTGAVSLVASDVGLGSVTNAAQLLVSNLSTDGTLASNSTTLIPSQSAVKTYADTKAAASHNHDSNYEAKNTNIQSHISDTTIHVTSGNKTTWDAKLSFVSAPASASSTGTAGQIAYDNDYFYTCVASNTWKRFIICTW